MIRVGTSGFSYPEWKGVFYPEKTKPADMLAFYATRFGAVEINAFFRRFPREPILTKWREAVPEDFRFSLKASFRITHAKKLVGTTEDVADFMKAAEPLGARLGPVLFQIPATLRFDAGRLRAFFAVLPPGRHYAFEPRDESYKTEAFRDALAEHGVAHCLNDEIFDASSYRVTAPFAYFRFRKEDYAPSELEARADVVRCLAAAGVDVYAFFMHEDDPKAALQALRFQELVGAAAPDVPPSAAP